VVVAIACLAIALASGALGALAGLIVLPLAVAGFAPPRSTAIAAVATAAVALAAGLAHDALGGAHVAALVAVGFAGVMAVWLAAERRRRDRESEFARFLGDAGALLGCSLDFDETAKAAAAVPVPELADWALVELFDPSGAIERRAASHPDEGAEALAAALVAGEPEQGRGPRSELWPELPAELLSGVEGVGARAAIRVPLRTPERRLGAMTLIASDSRRPYGERDLLHAEELAARAAVAIENAMLYRAARRGERRFARRAEPPASGRPQPRGTND
jgi:GAF domain-containing protein